MNKKSGVLLISLLVLLSLGVYYAMAGLTSVSISKAGDGHDVSGWITNKHTNVNITIVSDANVANFTVTLPQANITWEAIVPGVGKSENISDVLTNITYYTDGTAWNQWTCSNISDDASGQINCFIADTEKALGTTGNTSVVLTLNVSGHGTSVDEEYLLNFSVADNGTAPVTQEATLNLDALVPRLIDLNVTDGSMTLNNGSLYNSYGLSTRGSWTVRATILDSNLETSANTLLAYRCDSGNVGFLAADDNKTYITPTGSGTLRYIEGTISSACFPQFGGDTANVTFGLEVNDTFNHVTTLNETGVYSFTVTGMYETLPRIVSVNATTTSNSITSTLTSASSLDGTSDYLAAATATVDIEVAGNDTKQDLMIVWNETAGADTELKPTHTAWITKHLDLSTSAKNATTILSGVGEGTSVYSTTLTLETNCTDFAFYVYTNNSGANYTAIGGPYRFTVDSSGPTITMTPPDNKNVYLRGSIIYQCTASDAGSGLNTIRWDVTKPDGTTVTVQDYTALDSGTSDSITFSGDNTNVAGQYLVTCYVKDAVGNIGSKTSTTAEGFIARYSTSTAGEGSTSGGSAADVDLSTQEETTIKEKQGTISTFTLDGTTIHTIKIKTVDEVAGTVTIEISSDPITITLKIGETKEVDVDGDGTNDISLTLNKITSGVADITTKKLTPLPTEKPTEEVAPTEKPAEEITPTPEAASKTWLWILIIVIIVVIGVGYWFMKKK